MKQEHEKFKKFGMVIDLDKCTGCGSCMVACMAENNVPFKKDETDKLKSITWMHVYRLTNGKSFPDTDICYLPRPCMHCEGHCFGCRYCMAACPYHARYFNWWDPVWPDGMEKMLSPKVSPRMRGVVEKCSFCFHRYQAAKDKAFYEKRRDIKEDEYQTACTQACPAGAITFGDLNDKTHAVYALKKSRNAFRLLERLGTNPKVYYLSSREWVRRQADNYLPGEETGNTGGGNHH